MSFPRRLAVVLGLTVGTYALAVRPRMLRAGATDEEVRRMYPGAELIPGGERGATMAFTIDATPSRVWPWLVQMGCDRAGWYSWDRLDSDFIFWEPAHWIMQRRQFANLERRVARTMAINGRWSRPPRSPVPRAER